MALVPIGARLAFAAVEWDGFRSKDLRRRLEFKSHSRYDWLLFGKETDMHYNILFFTAVLFFVFSAYLMAPGKVKLDDADHAKVAAILMIFNVIKGAAFLLSSVALFIASFFIP
jgi:hypothetical protein